MAKCDEGYLCDVCGQDVAELTDSDLYLRYIIGLLDPEVLHTTKRAPHPLQPDARPVHRRRRFRAGRRRRPVRQTPARPQRSSANRKRLITRGWHRLKEVASLGIPIIEYPLPEVLAKIKSRSLGPN